MKSLEASTKNKKRGFTLIEVLVALVVFGLALLGFARLQLMNTQNYSSAYAQTQAIMHIEEMIAKLNTRREDAIAGLYNIELTHIQTVSHYAKSEKLSERTLYSWLKKVNATLPGAEGAIYCETKGLCVLTINYKSNMGAVEKSMMTHL